MITNDFDLLANTFINYVSEKLDKAGIDFDINNSVLYIEVDEGTYVINKHAPTKQIWLSSPVSGAKHFIYNDSKWVCTKTGVDLSVVLEDELGI